MATKVVYRNRAVSKKRRSKRKGFTLPMAIVGGFAMPVTRVYSAYKNGAANDKLNNAVGELVRDFTGFQPWVGGWDINHLQYGLLPVAAGVAIHKLASAFGINRMIAQAGVPILRI